MPWVAGQSGNPRGRPKKGKSVTELIEKVAQAKRTGAQMNRLEELVRKLFDLAIGGDVAAAKVILAYLEGMPVERVQAVVGTLPPFSADEAAEAQSVLADFRMELVMRGAEAEPAGAA
jgi:hypothetical protein